MTLTVTVFCVTISCLFVQASGSGSTRKSIETADAKLQHTLHFVQRLADKSVKSSDWTYGLGEDELTELQIIRAFLDGIESDTVIYHNTTQAAVDDARDDIAQCAEEARIDHEDYLDNDFQEMVAANASHFDCRNAESEASSDCKIWNDWRKLPPGTEDYEPYPDCGLTKESQTPYLDIVLQDAFIQTLIETELTKMETCLTQVERWRDFAWPQWRQCKQARADHKNVGDGGAASNESGCDFKQATLEQKACASFSKSNGICTEQIGCRNTAIGHRNVTHANASDAEIRFKADYYASEKILCYFKVFEANITYKPTQLQECHDFTPNTTFLDVTYHDIPAAFSCTPETIKPCDQVWKELYYINTPWYIPLTTTWQPPFLPVELKVCLPCGV